MDSPVIFSELAGSAFHAYQGTTKYPDWASWYVGERADDHAEILRSNPVECRIGDNVATIPMDDPRALSAWIKASKAPAKRGRKPAPKPTPSNLITAVLTLLSRIQARDPEGAVIPPWAIAPVLSALEEV